ncbi:MAG: acyl-CoA dehydrogenase family protein [Actinobacteria bacterium]|nr:acyl-CoA dehydrogenase family protein [Actinomycetota bacterium]
MSAADLSAAAGAVPEERRAIVETVRDFVEREVMPVAPELERNDTYPLELIEQMAELGLFGITIGEEWGGAGLDLGTYAEVTVELVRGWIAMSAVLNTHLMTSFLVEAFGTDEQRQRYLPRLARGEIRAAFVMSEPHAGTDVQRIRTVARPAGDGYEINGQKMWVTNGLYSGLVAVLLKTDPTTDPPYKGMSVFLIEKEGGQTEMPGMTIGPPIQKLGYKGIETVEIAFDDYRIPASQLLGGPEGLGMGFRYCMAGIEHGRITQTARAVGLMTAALEASLKYAGERETFGKKIGEHQAIQTKLALMATNLRASRLLMQSAALAKERNGRADVEAGMAKMFSTEAAVDATRMAMQVHGGYGYTKEFVVERLYRDAIALTAGEGSNEIQQQIIARQLMRDPSVGVGR